MAKGEHVFYTFFFWATKTSSQSRTASHTGAGIQLSDGNLGVHLLSLRCDVCEQIRAHTQLDETAFSLQTPTNMHLFKSLNLFLRDVTQTQHP